jgi:DNA modification methylase
MYQSIRRCHRFGQERIVNVVLVTTNIERPVHDNLERKQSETEHLKQLMKQQMKETWSVSSRTFNSSPENSEKDFPQIINKKSTTSIVETATARMILGDCVQGMAEHIEDDSVDYVIFSPPFQSLFRYSSNVCDVSNCQNEAEFEQHMAFVARELHRVLKPGRLMSFHCMAIPRRRFEHGPESAHSIIDVRGQLTRIFEGAGFLLQSEVCVFRDPIQALIRTKAQGLFYKSFVADASIVRQALPDYVVTMRKPGANQVPIQHDPKKHSMQEWIRLASPVWFINHNDTLNIKKVIHDAGKTMCKKTADALLAGLPQPPCDEDEVNDHDKEDDKEDDRDDDRDDAYEDNDVKERHPTPLQLPVIENCVSLWSNRGDIVLDPFSGIGSTGFVCKNMDRKYVGIELSSRYFEASIHHV